MRWWLVVTWWLTGCLWSSSVHAQNSTTPPTDTVTAEVLRTAQYQGKYTMQYLRLRRGTQAPAYAIWFPPVPRAGETQHQGGAVLFSNPYAGIDWSGEAVDLRAFERAARNEAFTVIPDAEERGYDPQQPTYIAYDYSVMHDAGGFALPFVMNGLGAMVMFERFYAGGSLQDHVNAAQTGLAFIQAQPGIQRSKVAIWGASWGGSISAYAAAQAPSNAKPALGVSITPIIDMGRYVSYGKVLPTLVNDAFQASTRLEPYVRRAAASATPSDTSYLSRLDASTLTSGLTMPFLFMHDTLDTIAPFLHAAPVYYSASASHEVMLYPHHNNTRDWRSFDVGHAPVQPGYDEGSALLFSFGYLLTHLSDAKDWILLPIMPSLQPEVLFPYLYAQRTLGYEANRYLRPRLLELCDARVFLVRYEDGFSKPVWGRAWVAEQLRTHWKLSVDASNVVQVLSEKGL